MLMGSPMPPQGGFWVIYAVLDGALKIKPASTMFAIPKLITSSVNIDKINFDFLFSIRYHYYTLGLLSRGIQVRHQDPEGAIPFRSRVLELSTTCT